MGGRARARSHRLARVTAFIAVAALGFTTVPSGPALANAPSLDGSPAQPKSPHVLTSAPAMAELPPDTPRTSPSAAKPASPTTATGPAQKPKSPTDPQAAIRAAQSAASAKAKRSGKAVDVPELTTERSTTEANPNGSFTSTTTFIPERAKVNGAWAPIDTTLAKNADGSLTPKAAVAGIVLSGGGTGPLASVSIGGKTVTMSWPLGALPTPQVTADNALYPQVLPGVDLRVSADAEGIREVLIVADHQAAANPALTSLAIKLGTSGVKLSQSDDGLAATDASTGRTIFTSPEPVMWDSTGDSTPSRVLAATDTSTQDSADSPAFGAHVVEMPVHLQGDTVTVTPSQSMIGDSHTAYPLYIDPAVSIGTYHYAEIYSGAALAGTVHFDGSVSGSPNGPIVRAGYDSSSSGYIRGMFSFDVADAMAGQESGLSNPTGGGLPEDGSDITGAQLKLTSNSNPCNNGANISMDVDGVNRMDPNAKPTWNQDGPSGTGHNDAGAWYAPVWASPTKLYSGNPTGCNGAGNTITIQDNTNGPLTSMVTNVWRNWTSHTGDAWCPCNGDGTATFGVKWTSEVASGTYGSWDVGASTGKNIPVTLIITYVPAPVINQTPTVTPGNSGTAINSNCGPDDSMPRTGPGTYISKNISNSVTLGASFYDMAGGEHINTQYEFDDVTDGSSNFYPGPGQGNYYPTISSAAGAQVPLPPQTITTASGQLQEGHTYKFYPRAIDTFDSNWLDSYIYGFSTSCRFTIAFQPPSPPTLAPNGAPDLPALGSGATPAQQMVAAEQDPAGITVQDSTAGVQIDHFDYVINGDSSKIPQNAAGCGANITGCLPAGANTSTGNGSAGFSASVNIPVPAGVTTMGDNSLWVQAVDLAGNRSCVFQYQFYLPGNPNAKPVLGDVTGNGYPSVVVAAPDPNNTNAEHLVAFAGNTDPDVAANGIEVAPSAAAPDGNSWANTLITHRGAERGMPVDDLFAYSTTTHALYYYLNSAVFGSPVPKDAFTGGSPTGGAHRIVVTRPACIPAPANNRCFGYASDWSNVTQILAFGNAAGGAPGTFAGRTNLITVESDGNHGANVWMFSPAGGDQVTSPVLLSNSNNTATFNWAKADLIAPGPTTSSGLPDLWVRDRNSGNLYQLTNKRNAAGVEDPTSLGDEANAQRIGALGAFQYDTNPVLVSAGNPTTTGAQTFAYPALWSVAEPGGQLKLMQGSSNGPLTDTTVKAASWPSSTTSWTNAAGAANVNGGTVTSATGPILMGVDTTTGTNLCMDLFHGDTTAGNFVQTWACNGSPAQLWTIAADGTVRWGSASSNACLTVSNSPAPAQHGLPSTQGNSGTNAGNWANTPVVIDPCPTTGTAPLGTQVWAFRLSGSAPQAGDGHGWYTVYNPASGMDLDNYKCDTGGGVQLDLWYAQDGKCGWFQAPASQDTWLQAVASGLASVSTEVASPSASVTTGQPTPSGNDYTLAATKVGDHYGVDWNIPYAGTYAIWAYMATGPGNGQVKVTVDQAAGNAALPMTYDTYAATAGSVKALFGDVNLTAGSHSFTFSVIGKNAASSGYTVGLDSLLADPDHGTGPHAKLKVPATGVMNVPVSADASVSFPGSAGITAYSFDFGDGSAPVNGTAPTVTHAYAAPGTYTVTTTVTDADNVSASIASQVTVLSGPPVANGNFETGDLSGWSASYNSGITTTNPHGGTYAGQINAPTGGNGSIEQVINGLTPNTSYTLTGWIRTDGGATILGVKDYDAADDDNGTTTTATVWTQLGGEFTTGPANTSVDVYCYRSTAGTSACDDFTLLATPAAGAAANPDFETGNLAGWTGSYHGTITATNPHGGTYAGQINAATGTPASIEQVVTGLIPNTSYTLTGWVRTDGGSTMLGAKQYDSAGNSTDATTTATGWTQLTDQFTTGASNTSVDIYCYRSVVGTSACDDITVAQTPATVANPDFEAGSLAGWNASYNAGVTNTNPHGGTYAGQINATADAGNGSVEQVVTGLTPNTTYTLTGWVRTDGGTTILGAKQYDAAGDNQDATTTATGWTQLSDQFTTDATGTSVDIYCYRDTVGTSACDDISLTKN